MGENQNESIDHQIGIYGYSTKFAGIGGRIRCRNEDFKVEEILDPNTAAKISEVQTLSNRYPIYKLVKEGIDTPHAIQLIKKVLGWKIHYLGLKDSRAFTVQYISPKRLKKEYPNIIKVSAKVCLELKGYYSNLLTRRSLAGNRFIIRIGDINNHSDMLDIRLSELKSSVDRFHIPNFYGYQRFGGSRPINHIIGENIVRGRFEDAVMVMLTHHWNDDTETRDLRDEMKDPAYYSSVLKRLKCNQDLERFVLRSLINHPQDWIKALRAIPITIRRLFVNAFQSYIFNRVMSKVVEINQDLAKIETGDICGIMETNDGSITMIRRSRLNNSYLNVKKIPLLQLIGYAYRAGEGRFDKITEKILKEEEILPRSFYIKRMPELSIVGGFRIPSLIVNDLTWDTPKQESFCRLQFSLLKGSYATILLRELIKPFNPVASGF